MSSETHPQKRHWAPEEDAYIRDQFAAGIGYKAMAKVTGDHPSVLAARGASLGLKRPDPLESAIKATRWSCDFCGTVSTASIDFGCRQCLPVRAAVA